MHRRTTPLALIVALALALGACGGDGGTTADRPPVGEGGTVVELRGLDFVPEVLTVAAGTEVTWEWTEELAHNVVGEDFQSDVMPRGSYQHTFDEPGEYDYRCTLHPGMDGTIVVE
jgi:plastocyanin